MMFFCVILIILTGFMKNTPAEPFIVGGPTSSLIVDSGEDVVLPCFLKPSISAENMSVEWLKLEDKTVNVHLYKDHKDRNYGQDERYRGRTSLFKEELKKGNTSLKLSAVQPSDEGHYNCLIESISEYDDIKIHLKIRVEVFQAWKIGLICISIFICGLIVFAAFIFKGSPLHSKWQLSPVQCSAIAYMHLHSENVRNEWDLAKYNTSQAGYRHLIPAITNCRKARLAGFNVTEQSITLCKALESENSSLKELDLSYSDLQGSGLGELSDGLKRLETLRLTMCELCEESFDTVQIVLQSGNSTLKELDLSYNNLQDSGMEKLCAGLTSPQCKLETLRLAGCNLTETLIKTLSEALLSKNSSLKELDLSYSDLQGSRLELLSEALKRLETLRLSMCKLRKMACGSLRSILQSENCLKNLDLSENNLQDSGVEELCAGLESSYHKLETLRLDVCGLGEQTCEKLSLVLQSENSLRKLDLSYNDLLDSGVEKLCEGLKSSHCKLETLRLSHCIITEKGCSSLASALNSNPSNLKELDLSCNHPGDTGEKLITDKKKDSMYKLEIFRADHAGEIRIDPSPKKYACELTLDPNTAHKELSLSKGNRKVERVKEEKSYPDHPERYNHWRQVLCRESLTGRCYWETEWSGKGVYVSVAYKSIRRKGDGEDSWFGRNEKSWCLTCSNDSYSVCHNKISTAIPCPSSGSKRVGVYVDCPAGTLSFYSVSTDTHTLTHLHTFTTTFTEPLCPGFYFWSSGSSVSFCQME